MVLLVIHCRFLGDSKVVGAYQITNGQEADIFLMIWLEIYWVSSSKGWKRMTRPSLAVPFTDKESSSLERSDDLCALFADMAKHTRNCGRRTGHQLRWK